MKKLFPASTRLRFPIKKEYVFSYIYIYVLMKQPSIKKYTNYEQKEVSCKQKKNSKKQINITKENTSSNAWS